MDARGVVLVLLVAVLASSCAQTADEDAAYESQEDLIEALDDGGFPCGRVDVRVRDREGQVLVDSSPDGPGLEHPAYVRGTDWVVSSGDFATGIDVMAEVAVSIGGRANETRCLDLESFLDCVEADGRALADLSVAELKAGLGEE